PPEGLLAPRDRPEGVGFFYTAYAGGDCAIFTSYRRSAKRPVRSHICRSTMICGVDPDQRCRNSLHPPLLARLMLSYWQNGIPSRIIRLSGWIGCRKNLHLGSTHNWRIFLRYCNT